MSSGHLMRRAEARCESDWERSRKPDALYLAERIWGVLQLLGRAEAEERRILRRLGWWARVRDARRAKLDAVPKRDPFRVALGLRLAVGEAEELIDSGREELAEVQDAIGGSRDYLRDVLGIENAASSAAG